MKRNVLVSSVLFLVTFLCFSIIANGTQKPEVVSLSVNKGFNNETVNLTITGSKFHKSTYVKLTKDGEADIIATNLQVVSKTEVTCALDLNGRTAGTWNVVVGNIGTFTKKEKPTILADAFTIETPAPTEKPVVETPTEPEPAPAEPEPIVEEVEPVATPASTTEESGPSLESLNESLKAIFFDFDKFDIRQDQTANLDANAAILKDNSGLVITLGGHADERGTIQYNMVLSRKRAETVKDYLVAQGVAGDQIVIFAYGEEFPAKKEHNESAWAYNRRVDIRVWEETPTKEEALKQ
ncbi:MAG: OmpA family protein [Bacillota bacterium]